MVVPMESFSAASSKCKKYIGNGLVIHLQENNSTVHVIGNECTIKMDINNGTLKVIGNSCRVKVHNGNGKIIYNGNEGRIRLGSNIEEKNVTYIGNEGKILKGVSASKINSKSTKEYQQPLNNSKQTKEEVSKEKTRRSSNSTLNIINKSHKCFSLSESMISLTIPSVIVVPNVTESVIRIRRTKK